MYLMSNAHPADVKKFLAASKSALKKITTYATTGGDVVNWSKEEIALAGVRDRLEDKMRPLGVTDDAACIAAMDGVKQALRNAREAASNVRQAFRTSEIRRLTDEMRAAEHADPYARELKIARAKGQL
jgi:hypothetical protein